MIEKAFFLGDLVQVKDSHPFHGLANKIGQIEQLVGTVAAIVRFSRNEAAWDTTAEKLDSKIFQGYTWYITLKDLDKLSSNPDSEFANLLEKKELEEKLEGYKQALELSEELREQLGNELDKHMKG